MNAPINAPILPAARALTAPSAPTASAAPTVPPGPPEPPDPRAPARSTDAGPDAGPDPLPRIRSALHGGVLTVALAGEFDHFTCDPLRGLLDEGAVRGARHLVLDAALVSFCDSALLDVLDRWVLSGRSWESAGASRSARLLFSLEARIRPGHGVRQGVGP
ncbi:STAS domain-containing protein [Streptomyces sp. DK15]|uniref:STAS domain-containing protein n=1 Tax=Streptomyces sp. DK15 TaxID=2957499 RepID=UPI0029AFE669|nr:STAS domain-containing protein [Streptomyces sp. DK15]MDX2390537.1 STAS domain-containing protein [Streptomyces sp. DK15]